MNNLNSLIIKGRSGPNTRRAISAFQKSRGLPVTGRADDATLRALTGAEEAPRVSSPSRETVIDLPEIDLRVAQQALNDVARSTGRQEFNCGRPDGLMGRKTRSAIEAFQGFKQIPVTGKLNQATFDALMTSR